MKIDNKTINAIGLIARYNAVLTLQKEVNEDLATPLVDSLSPEGKEVIALYDDATTNAKKFMTEKFYSKAG